MKRNHFRNFRFIVPFSLWDQPPSSGAREEMDEKLGEMVHSTNERFVTVVERQEKADTQREEALAEIREELEGLNGKIEEVLYPLI